MRDVKDESVHLVVTSPPYFNLVTYAGSEGQLGHIDGYEEFLDELDAVWAECRRVLIPVGRMCIVVGDVCLPVVRQEDTTCCRSAPTLPCARGGSASTASTASFGRRSRTSASKAPAGRASWESPISRTVSSRTTSSASSFSVNQARTGAVEPGRARESWIDTDSYSRWFTHTWSDIPGARRSAHPAPFPLEIPMRLVQMSSFQGETVLDPFAGTGTTALAALKTGRNSVGYDIEPDYIDLARERLRDLKSLAAFETACGVGRPVKSAA